MNVCITPRRTPSRTDLYPGVQTVRADGAWLWLHSRYGVHRLPIAAVAEIALDDEPGGG